jgi:Xaa-Pro aminopeptidase
MSYLVLTQTDTFLFINSHKLTDEVKAHISHVQIREYDEVTDFLPTLELSDNNRILIDPSRCNLAVFQSVPQDGSLFCCFVIAYLHVSLFLPRLAIYQDMSPIYATKAHKNPTEIEGMRQCHIRDAAAKISFLCWLEDTLRDTPDGKETLTEYEAAQKLQQFREQQPDFVSLSFETISSAGPNGAVIHYSPKEHGSRIIKKTDMYLVDSGGQYRDGTTDVTRTLHFGTPTQHQKEMFTLVLKGHIGFARAVFPSGTPGTFVDPFARQFLWEKGLDYRHGTGHGVGAFLNVHEGPHVAFFCFVFC